MPARCSVYIDAGYLLASAATRVTGTSLRSGIHVEFGKLIEGIRRQAAEVSGMPVLRVHWYDSARNGIPDIQQQRIGELPRVKLRLGRFGIDGQQKGVDLRLGLDLVTHARNQTADAFVLVSGDDDFTEAVEEAQAHGVEVILLAAPDAHGSAHAVSRHLQRAVDEIYLIDGELVDEAVLKVERPAVAEPDEVDVDGVEVPPEAADGAGAVDGPAQVPAAEAPGSPEAPEGAEAAGAETAEVPARTPAPVPGPGRRPAAAAPTSAPAPGPRPGPAPSPTPTPTPSPTPTPTPTPGPAPVPAPGPIPGPRPGRGAAAEPAVPPATPTVPTEPAPRAESAAVPAAPRTPKDIAAVMRRPEGDGVPLPHDAVARPGTWADEFRTTVASVVVRVLNSLALSSTPTAWRALELGRPSIPREVDKALLVDVTAAMGVIDLSDLERHEIREAFWKAYDALMAAARG